MLMKRLILWATAITLANIWQPAFSQPAQIAPPPETSAAKAQSNTNPPPDQPVLLHVSSATVRDAQSQVFGRIEDILVDPSSGKIEFAFVAVTVFTNNGIAKITPIPWRLLASRAERFGLYGSPGLNQTFQVNMDRQKLMKAPAFDRRKWPDLSQKDWSHPYLSFYGVEAGTGEKKIRASEETPPATEHR